MFISIFLLVWVEEAESDSMKSPYREKGTSPGFKQCMFASLKVLRRNALLKMLIASVQQPLFSSYMKLHSLVSTSRKV